MTKSASVILHNLCNNFMLIYVTWEEKHSDALAKRMLEQDIQRLGLFLGSVDEFGQMAELTLVAECVAYVRTLDSVIDQSRAIDYWTDVVLEELQPFRFTRPYPNEVMNDMVQQLETWSLTKELLENGNITKDVAEKFAKNYIELADVFFMRDGNITSKKMTAMRDLETALSLVSPE